MSIDVMLRELINFVSVTINHHTLFSILNKMRVVSVFLTKLLSANTDQTSANRLILFIFYLNPIKAATIHTLDLQCCLSDKRISNKHVLIENSKVNKVVTCWCSESKWSHLKFDVGSSLRVRFAHLIIKLNLGVYCHLSEKGTQIDFKWCLEHSYRQKTNWNN